MREILFRGKRIDNGKWIEGMLNALGEKVALIGTYIDYGTHVCGVSSYLVIPETVGQYTGLTDKNGKKIFEGDIVKVNITQSEDIRTYGDCKYKIGVIVYNEDYAYFTCKNNFMNFMNWAFNDYKVIGNIHDNPKLLKGE